MRISRFPILVVALTFLVSACSSAEAEPEIATTVTTTTSTTVAPTTTTAAPVVEFAFDMPDGMEEPLKALYTWLVEDRTEAPVAPTGMLAHLENTERDYPTGTGAVTSAALENGDGVAVARVDRDIVLLVDDGAGWRIVGAALDGSTPWLGDKHKTVLVLGSDARVGEDEQKLRADSVHILTVSAEVDAGTIAGFPRDSWVQGPNGGTKLTNLMANRGPEIMLETITELTQLEIDGYFVTGFKGFTALIVELGGLFIDLPKEMRSGNNWANYPAGPQTLTAQLALRLARIRKGLPGGDFDRSFNQGLIMQAAMDMVQVTGIDLLPEWIRILDEATWTNLSTEQVLTLGASAFLFPSDALNNMVMPGGVGTVGAASVVFLSDKAEGVYRDLEDDGLLTPEE
ncbi:MAG: LCP family protein [Acidimicrobiia bacterium]|nr:LCP family protein [Acidimicrobiia bacterium]MDX2467619.1 LCP family protein [Acidimicrobiia bacterium]